MGSIRNPSKEQVRDWLRRQIASHQPPDMKQIRRELGWELAAEARKRPSCRTPGRK
jgi:hypothetical protein